MKTELDLEFLEKCKIFNLIPKFLRFRLYKRALHHSKLYESWQNKLLVNEIRSKRHRVSHCKVEQSSKLQVLEDNFSLIDGFYARHHINNLVDIYKNEISITHKKKLYDLGASNDIAPCDPNKVVFNNSSVTLSERVRLLLAYGLDFCLPIYKLDFNQYFLSFERILKGGVSKKIFYTFFFSDYDEILVSCVKLKKK